MKKNIFETIAMMIVQNNAHQFVQLDEEYQEIRNETLNRIFRQMYSLTILLKTFLEREIEHDMIEIEEDVFETFMIHQEMLGIEFRNALQSLDSHPGEMIATVCLKHILPNAKNSMNFVQTLAFIGQIFVLLNITHCIQEDDIEFDGNEEDIESLQICNSIIKTFAEEVEIIEMIDTPCSMNFPKGDAMNAKEEVVFGIMQHITEYASIESLKHIQRTAMYIALHSDQINVMKDHTTHDHAIQFGIANIFINNNETIHSICEHLIAHDVLHEQAQEEIVRTIFHFLCNEEEQPLIDNPIDYAHVVYDMFQMLRLSFVIEDRIELINAMKTVFSYEEHEEYQELIQYLNATSGALSEESTT